MKYTAILKQEGEWWIGWVQNVPGVNCQERTREELLESIKEALYEALDFHRQEILDLVGEDYEELVITV